MQLKLVWGISCRLNMCQAVFVGTDTFHKMIDISIVLICIDSVMRITFDGKNNLCFILDFMYNLESIYFALR